MAHIGTRVWRPVRLYGKQTSAIQRATVRERVYGAVTKRQASVRSALCSAAVRPFSAIFCRSPLLSMALVVLQGWEARDKAFTRP